MAEKIKRHERQENEIPSKKLKLSTEEIKNSTPEKFETKIYAVMGQTLVPIDDLKENSTCEKPESKNNPESPGKNIASDAGIRDTTPHMDEKDLNEIISYLDSLKQKVE